MQNIALDNMINSQLRTWEILDERVLNAVAATPRENFVPEAYQSLAYSDTVTPLAHEQVMLTPKEQARMLQALEITAADRVLEVGTGSGYVTALLSRLAKDVVSIDVFADFTEQAALRLQALNVSNVHCLTLDAFKNWENVQQHGPFDVILCSPGLQVLPLYLLKSLPSRGRLFAIIGKSPAMSASVFKRQAGIEWQETSLFETVVPYAVNMEELEAFVF